MIRLIIEDYCKDCAYFEANVNQIRIEDYCDSFSCYTTIECKNKDLCKTMLDHLINYTKREDKDSMIKIHKNPNGDTRTAPKNVTFEEFAEANDSHISDVKRVLKRLADVVSLTGEIHDRTKKSYELEFYNDFKDTLVNGSNFVEGEWYKMHIEKERHHLLSRCPDDVDLLDVIEMIVDCVCAGKARSGEVRPLEISDDILRLAVKNTVKLIDDMTEVEE